MIRLTFAAVLLALLGVPVVRAESIADHCPVYVTQLQSARDSLVRGDRARAITALREAQVALGDCMRRECDETGERVLLADSSRASLADQYGCSACRSTSSTAAGSTLRPASS